MEYFIYYLHRGDNIPCYIGKTKNKLQDRVVAHRRTKNEPLYEIEMIDKVENHREEEEFYITMFKSWGFELENKNKGGGGSPFHTQSTRDKMSRNHKGRICTWGDKISKSTMGNNSSGEVLQYDKENNFIKEWPSARHAEIHYKHSKMGDGIRACIRGEQKSAYGFIWRTKI